jgi:hypothetical protein
METREEGERLVISIEPFVKPSAGVRRAAEEEARRLAEFVGGEPELIWSDRLP